MRRTVVYSLTRNLYPHLKYAIKSLLEHTQVDRIYILAEDDTLPFVLPPQAVVMNVSKQTIFSPYGPNYSTQFTHMALVRAAYADLLPDEDLVLQLDIDTVVMDDISDLWEIDYSGYYISCTQEFLGTYRPYGDKYYNIGVCMFNLAKMRADGIDRALINLLNSVPLTYVEQDALNILCRGMIKPMGVEYNTSMVTGRTEHTRIEHFAGAPNWWNDPAYWRAIAPLCT